MAVPETPDRKAVRLYPPPPKDFDPFAATVEDLKRHGLPLRPDPHRQPGMAALWDRKARRYRSFDHLEPELDTATAVTKALPASPFGLDPIESSGYSLSSTGAPFTALFATWTVPDLRFNPSQVEAVDQFHTFVTRGFLDVHVEMTVDSAENVSSVLSTSVGQPNLPVRSAAPCVSRPMARLPISSPTRPQARPSTSRSKPGFPLPSRSARASLAAETPTSPPQLQPLARFGAVYFDEISAYTTSGYVSLTSAGDAVTMVDQNGSTLAYPVMLNDYAFKVVYEAA